MLSFHDLEQIVSSDFLPSSLRLCPLYSPAAPPSLQPYERYEQGFVHHFFDPTSTADKGRFRVYDARDFQVS